MCMGSETLSINFCYMTICWSVYNYFAHEWGLWYLPSIIWNISHYRVITELSNVDILRGYHINKVTAVVTITSTLTRKALKYWESAKVLLDDNNFIQLSNLSLQEWIFISDSKNSWLLSSKAGFAHLRENVCT